MQQTETTHTAAIRSVTERLDAAEAALAQETQRADKLLTDNAKLGGACTRVLCFYGVLFLRCCVSTVLCFLRFLRVRARCVCW